MNALPTYAELYQWVCSKEEDAIVGEAGGSFTCPLATYLKETRGESWGIRTSYAHRRYSSEASAVHMEPWLIEIVQKVDALGFLAAIPASVFKHILEEVTPSIP